MPAGAAASCRERLIRLMHVENIFLEKKWLSEPLFFQKGCPITTTRIACNHAR
jgi:hypothetical protein